MFSSLSVSQKRWGEEKGVLILALSQSRSSLYTGYTSCVGPPKHQGALKDVFILVLFLNLASGYENKNDHLFLFSGALSSSIRKNQSNHVTWMSYGLLLLQKTKKNALKAYGAAEEIMWARFETEWNTDKCLCELILPGSVSLLVVKLWDRVIKKYMLELFSF